MNTIQLIHLLLGIITMLLAGIVWLISTLLKLQEKSLKTEWKQEKGDITLNSYMNGLERDIKDALRQIQYIEAHLTRVETLAQDNRNILIIHFPDSFKRGSDR